MKTKIYFTLLFILCIAFSNIAIAQKSKDIEEKVKELTQKMATEMLAGNFSTDHYTQDAISMPNNSPMLEGIDAIKASYVQMAGMGIKFNKVEFVTTNVIVDKNYVTEIGTYAMSMTMPNMPQPINDKGKYITIWEIQKDGSLKIKVETWNSDMPPMGMN